MLADEIEFLFSLRKFGMKLGLEKMINFLALIGNVHEKIKFVHVAGTNGKGSVVSFVSSILIEHGYKVGIYTSPHFVRFNERIKIGSAQIPNDRVESFLKEYKDYIIQKELTFFEVTTALALLYFYEQKVDYAVLETGLGGRLDATNVVNPEVEIITSISYDHTQYLGEKLSDIAFEKAGIIKPNSKVCFGLLTDEIENLLIENAFEKNAQYVSLSDYYDLENKILKYNQLEILDLRSPIRGDYQLANAALASIAVNNLINSNDSSLYMSGLKNVLGNTGFEGRYEVMNNEPTVILDSAHNSDSISKLIKEIKKDKKKFSKTSLLFTALKDKRVFEMIKSFEGVVDNILLTTIDFERALTNEDLNKLSEEFINVECSIVENPGKYVEQYIKTAQKNERLVVCGSMYLLGEIKSFFLQKENYFI